MRQITIIHTHTYLHSKIISQLFILIIYITVKKKKTKDNWSLVTALTGIKKEKSTSHFSTYGQLEGKIKEAILVLCLIYIYHKPYWVFDKFLGLSFFVIMSCQNCIFNHCVSPCRVIKDAPLQEPVFVDDWHCYPHFSFQLVSGAERKSSVHCCIALYSRKL